MVMNLDLDPTLVDEAVAGGGQVQRTPHRRVAVAAPLLFRVRRGGHARRVSPRLAIASG
ncbi:MAG: hypothetical protein H0X67_21490 [Acidobacteria bacterium]|nr:hypothetical protein [Acidobacteriota bacterium]